MSVLFWTEVVRPDPVFFDMMFRSSRLSGFCFSSPHLSMLDASIGGKPVNVRVHESFAGDWRHHIAMKLDGLAISEPTAAEGRLR
ncbi:hypothetical protein [Bradyrhizobium sp. 191]|uniref:hypothetical protein n=1 Tax=Bradyrhizobium sp. 191 TaxID=2782659 RepID=UPI001FFE8BEE|nr:hypothetical protein [Bradyrhizobium sp. 191]UPJ68735.1 hypothetical protein IVB23_16615 [Bradyrhizobium sp. 191]